MNKSINQLAKESGVSASCISERLRKGWALDEALNAPKWNYKRKKTVFPTRTKMADAKDKVVELRELGMTTKEIAKEVGLSSNTIQNIVEKYDLPHISKEIIDVRRKKSVKNEAIKILKNIGYEYINGYEDCESIVTVRRICCCHVFTYNFHNLVSRSRRNTFECPICREQRLIDEKNKGKIDMLLKKQERRLNNQIKRERKKPLVFYIRNCKICGQEFITSKVQSKCCSAICSHKLANRNHDRRLIGKVVDNDITLDKLYKKYNGRCYLCGKKTNIYADPNSCDYPSIEHIIPLARGGMHEWSNVNLAHRSCNTLKGDKLIVRNFKQIPLTF